jgi:S-adenosylmethionine/arginine decarboxylase-like enzyme
MKTRKNVNKKPWGQHLILDVEKCNPSLIRSPQQIKAFVKELVPAIGMKAFGEPRIVRFGTERVKGYTLVQLIETSDITCHFSEEDNSAYFDLFSCKPFHVRLAKNLFLRYFEPERMHARVVNRGGHARMTKTRYAKRQ